MKYKGKYSLNENLLKGRGMGLLNEMMTFQQFKQAKDDGTYYEQRDDGKFYRTGGMGKAGYDSAEALMKKSYAAYKRGARGSTSQAGLATHLAGKGIQSTPGGRGGATDLTLSDGVECEVGDPTKYLETGKFKNGAFVTPRASAKPKVDYLNGEGIVDGDTLTPAQVQKVWELGGDDIAIYIENEASGKYKAVALTAAGTNSVLGKLPLLKASDCVASVVNNANTGSSDAERMGIPFNSINWSSVGTYI